MIINNKFNIQKGSSAAQPQAQHDGGEEGGMEGKERANAPTKPPRPGATQGAGRGEGRRRHGIQLWAIVGRREGGTGAKLTHQGQAAEG